MPNWDEDVDERDGSSMDLENTEGLTQIHLYGCDYWVKIPTGYLGSLQLMEEAVSSPEANYHISQLLQMLKKTWTVRTMDSDGEVDQTTARRMFVAALQRKERELADRLKARVEGNDAADYLG